jgi:outer membrane protein OmpA-like peptidoglycan-associated protein/tetratricopeptide (TPR) repeat protein
MIRFYLIIASLILHLIAGAQVSSGDLQIADKLFLNKSYPAALNYYSVLANNDPNNRFFNYRTGICYFYSRSQKALSIKFLERSVRDISTSQQLKGENIPDNVFKILGEAYQNIYDFDKAIYNYEKYKALLKDSESSNQKVAEELNWRIDMCRVGKALNGLADNSINLKKEKNTKPVESPRYGNYSSVLSTDKEKMTFTLKRQEVKPKGSPVFDDARYYEDCFNPLKADTPIVDGKQIKFEKKNINETTVATSYDGQIILNYRDENGTACLYTSCLNGNSWTYPEKISKPINDNGWEHDECISADGSVMYFTSSRKGGYGGKDIYVCKKNEEGEWGRAQNLGPQINTAYDEEAPFIHPDGTTLYFSSNGRNNVGKFDIYTSSFVSNSWSSPLNVGFPADTTIKQEPIKEKATIVIAEKKKSGRKKKTAVENKNISETRENYLISFNNPNGAPLTLLKGEFLAENKSISGPVKISVNNNNSGAVSSVYLSDSLKQKFAIILPPARNNNITYKKEGYVIFSENIDLSVKNDLYERRDPVVLNPVSEGAKIVLNNIFFEQGLPALTNTSGVALKDLNDFLRSHPDLKVELTNTIVAKQDIKQNSKLSQERAENIKKCLCTYGIPKDRIITKGVAMKLKKSPAKKIDQWVEMTIVENNETNDMLSNSK